MSEPPVADLNEFQIYNSQVSIETLPIFTRLQLANFNGTDEPLLYVGIRGFIYDVSSNEKNYGPGKGYHKLVGKDVSRLLALNRLQLNPEDAVESGKENTWFTGDLTEKQNDTVDKWVVFFQKRYKIVGVIIDHQNTKTAN